jgi:hypothetical protein
LNQDTRYPQKLRATRKIAMKNQPNPELMQQIGERINELFLNATPEQQVKLAMELLSEELMVYFSNAD